MVVDAVRFAKRFELVDYRVETGEQKYRFPFLDNYSLMNIYVTINWRMSVSYVRTPDQKIVVNQSFYVSGNNWYSPLVSEPTITSPININYSQKKGAVNVPISSISGTYFVGKDTFYMSDKGSSKITVFDGNSSVKASAQFFVTHKSSSIPMYSETVYLNF